LFLLDTRALASDCISINLPRSLEEAGIVKFDDSDGNVVCCPLLEVIAKNTYKFFTRFKNEIFESITIRAIAIDMRFDKIIERKLAIKHDLLAKFSHNSKVLRRSVLKCAIVRSHISTLPGPMLYLLLPVFSEGE